MHIPRSALLGVKLLNTSPPVKCSDALRLVVAKSLLLMLLVIMLALVRPHSGTKKVVSDVSTSNLLTTPNAGGLASLVMDLRITHERWVSTSNPSVSKGNYITRLT